MGDSDLVKAITDEAGDPSALGTIKATHVAADGANTGLPGAKACKQSWTTTESAGRESQGGDPVIVTFDLYSNLAEIQSGSPDNTPTMRPLAPCPSMPRAMAAIRTSPRTAISSG